MEIHVKLATKFVKENKVTIFRMTGLVSPVTTKTSKISGN
jgi:hypothetical protein